MIINDDENDDNKGGGPNLGGRSYHLLLMNAPTARNGVK